MEQIGVHETKTNLSALLKRIALGEEFEITNRGKVVAKIVPPKKQRVDQTTKVLDEFKALTKDLKLGTFEELMEWRKLGRKGG